MPGGGGGRLSFLFPPGGPVSVRRLLLLPPEGRDAAAGGAGLPLPGAPSQRGGAAALPGALLLLWHHGRLSRAGAAQRPQERPPQHREAVSGRRALFFPSSVRTGAQAPREAAWQRWQGGQGCPPRVMRRPARPAGPELSPRNPFRWHIEPAAALVPGAPLPTRGWDLIRLLSRLQPFLRGWPPEDPLALGVAKGSSPALALPSKIEKANFKALLGVPRPGRVVGGPVLEPVPAWPACRMIDLGTPPHPRLARPSLQFSLRAVGEMLGEMKAPSHSFQRSAPFLPRETGISEARRGWAIWVRRRPCVRWRSPLSLPSSLFRFPPAGFSRATEGKAPRGRSGGGVRGPVENFFGPTEWETVGPGKETSLKPPKMDSSWLASYS